MSAAATAQCALNERGTGTGTEIIWGESKRTYNMSWQFLKTFDLFSFDVVYMCTFVKRYTERAVSIWEKWMESHFTKWIQSRLHLLKTVDVSISIHFTECALHWKWMNCVTLDVYYSVLVSCVTAPENFFVCFIASNLFSSSIQWCCFSGPFFPFVVCTRWRNANS